MCVCCESGSGYRKCKSKTEVHYSTRGRGPETTGTHSKARGWVARRPMSGSRTDTTSTDSMCRKGRGGERRGAGPSLRPSRTSKRLAGARSRKTPGTKRRTTQTSTWAWTTTTTGACVGRVRTSRRGRGSPRPTTRPTTTRGPYSGTSPATGPVVSVSRRAPCRTGHSPGRPGPGRRPRGTTPTTGGRRRIAPRGATRKRHRGPWVGTVTGRWDGVPGTKVGGPVLCLLVVIRLFTEGRNRRVVGVGSPQGCPSGPPLPRVRVPLHVYDGRRDHEDGGPVGRD